MNIPNTPQKKTHIKRVRPQMVSKAPIAQATPALPISQNAVSQLPPGIINQALVK